MKILKSIREIKAKYLAKCLSEEITLENCLDIAMTYRKRMIDENANLDMTIYVTIETFSVYVKRLTNEEPGFEFVAGFMHSKKNPCTLKQIIDFTTAMNKLLKKREWKH